MESATRKTTTSRKFLSNLAKCIDANIIPALIGEKDLSR
jgi:hypothetical protein